jgi:hypothetical protein
MRHGSQFIRIEIYILGLRFLEKLIPTYPEQKLMTTGFRLKRAAQL